MRRNEEEYVKFHAVIHLDKEEYKAILLEVIDIEHMESLSAKIWIPRSHIKEYHLVEGKGNVYEFTVTAWIARTKEIDPVDVDKEEEEEEEELLHKDEEGSPGNYSYDDWDDDIPF